MKGAASESSQIAASATSSASPKRPSHYFGGRKEVYIALLERLGAMREEQLPPPVGRSARARLGDSVSCRLDWTAHNRAVWLAGLGRGEDIADPDIRNVVTRLVRRAVALLAAQHADIADDSPRLRYALECWTGLNRAATHRWQQGDATREQTHELITSTLEHVLRTFGAPPKPTGHAPPLRSGTVTWPRECRNVSGARRCFVAPAKVELVRSFPGGWEVEWDLDRHRPGGGATSDMTSARACCRACSRPPVGAAAISNGAGYWSQVMPSGGGVPPSR